MGLLDITAGTKLQNINQLFDLKFYYGYTMNFVERTMIYDIKIDRKNNRCITMRFELEFHVAMADGEVYTTKDDEYIVSVGFKSYSCKYGQYGGWIREILVHENKWEDFYCQDVESLLTMLSPEWINLFIIDLLKKEKIRFVHQYLMKSKYNI